ncbi:DUF397 domain-containing protein [Streptomyces sp. NPDC002835]
MKSSPEYDLTTAIWHKSSYSGGDGGNCVEVATAWRKSTYSDASDNQCLEVADGHPDVVPVRDSKDPDGPKLAFRPGPWSAFVTELKRN